MKKGREGNPSRAAEIEQFVLDAGSADVPTFGGTFLGGVYLQQSPYEIARVIDAILDSGVKIRTYLEIGVAAGGTTYLIHHYFRPEKIVLVDDGLHWQTEHRSRILAGIDCVTLQGNSMDPAIVERVRDAADGYDLLFVDGDHAYTSSRADANNYIPMIREGGFLVMHDTAYVGWGPMFVKDELKKDPSVEFVAEYVTDVPVKSGISCGLALFRKVTPHVPKQVRINVAESLSTEEEVR